MGKIHTLAHILSGLLTALSTLVHPVLSVLGFTVFFVYEATERKVLGDQMFVEMREFGYGFFTGIIILIMMKLLTG